MNRSTWGAIVALLVIPLSYGHAEAPYLDDPLQYDIMSDAIFMKAAWHFQIDDVQSNSQRITVTTTGANFYFSPSTDRVLCEQRLPRQRRSLLLRFPAGALAGLQILAQDSGAVILQSKFGLRFKVNCDSLLMIRSQRPAAVRGRILFKPVQTYSYGTDHLVMDAYGAVGLYSMNGVSGGQKSAGVPEYIYQLGGEGMVWCAIGPPRPYPWEKSIDERLIWHGSWRSPELAVPSNELIDELKDKGTILWLQSEVMLWKTWYHQDFFPRLPDEFQRVIDHSHEVGLRVMAYASPFYFVKGNAGRVSYDGKNMGLYLAELRDLLKRYPGLDGIYFDGVYLGSVKNTYIVCRAVRELIGDDRILEIHCTSNAPGGLCYNPAADTWADFILRGEGQGFVSQNWLRFFVSCYNISNAIGVVCNNAGYWAPTKEQVEMTLRANARLAFMPWIPEEFTREQWEINVRGVGHKPNYGPAKEIKQRHDYAMENWYWPRLNGKLPAWVKDINEQLFASGKAAQPQLAAPPYPLPGLTEQMLQSAQQGWLVMDSFGADAPEYISPMILNGVSIGSLPPSAGDEWTRQVKAVLPVEALHSLQATNRLVVKNPARDCFKLRNIYLVVVLDDGRRASSKVVRSSYCSAGSWIYSEGFSVPIGEPLTIELPVSLE